MRGKQSYNNDPEDQIKQNVREDAGAFDVEVRFPVICAVNNSFCFYMHYAFGVMRVL